MRELGPDLVKQIRSFPEVELQARGAFPVFANEATLMLSEIDMLLDAVTTLRQPSRTADSLLLLLRQCEESLRSLRQDILEVRNQLAHGQLVDINRPTVIDERSPAAVSLSKLVKIVGPLERTEFVEEKVAAPSINRRIDSLPLSEQRESRWQLLASILAAALGAVSVLIAIPGVIGALTNISVFGGFGTLDWAATVLPWFAFPAFVSGVYIAVRGASKIDFRVQASLLQAEESLENAVKTAEQETNS